MRAQRLSLSTIVILLVATPQLGAQDLVYFPIDFEKGGPSGDPYKMFVSVFLDGSVQETIDDGDDAGGIASAGLRIALRDFLVGARISTTPSSDSITAGFGSTMLHPLGASSGRSATLEVAQPNLWKLGQDFANTGWGAYGFVQSARWQPASRDAQDVDLVGLGAYIFHTIIGPSDRTESDSASRSPGDQNEAGISFGVGPTLRFLGGEASDDFVSAALGDIESLGTVWGGEGFLALTLDRFTLYTRVYVLSGSDVPGLHGFNAAFGVSLRGFLYQGLFRRYPPR